MFRKIVVLDKFVELTGKNLSCKPTTLKEAPAWIFSKHFFWMNTCERLVLVRQLFRSTLRNMVPVFVENENQPHRICFPEKLQMRSAIFRNTKTVKLAGFFLLLMFLYFEKPFPHCYQSDWQKGLQSNWQKLLLNVAVFNRFTVFRGFNELFCRVTVNSYIFNSFFEPNTRAVFRFLSNICGGASCIDWFLWTPKNCHRRCSIKKVFLKIS